MLLLSGASERVRTGANVMQMLCIYDALVEVERSLHDFI